MRGSRLLEKVWGGHHAEYFNFSKFLNSHLEVVENRPLDPLVRKPLGYSLSWGKSLDQQSDSNPNGVIRITGFIVYTNKVTYQV